MRRTSRNGLCFIAFTFFRRPVEHGLIRFINVFLVIRGTVLKQMLHMVMPTCCLVPLPLLFNVSYFDTFHKKSTSALLM